MFDFYEYSFYVSYLIKPTLATLTSSAEIIQELYIHSPSFPQLLSKLTSQSYDTLPLSCHRGGLYDVLLHTGMLAVYLSYLKRK